MVCIWVAVYIYNDDNRYTTNAFTLEDICMLFIQKVK